MEMSDDEDDDIPGLESVSSSEYIEDSESDSDVFEDISPDVTSWKDPTKLNYQVAKKWLEQEPAVLQKHVEVIVIHLLSPFLYGHAHQSDCWLRWCHEAGLLISDVDYNTGCLGDTERDVIDVLDMALLFCKRVCMQPENPPEALAWLLTVADEIGSVDSLKVAIKLAKNCEFFHKMLSDVTSSKCNSIGGLIKTQENFVEVGCLYAINQTAEHVKEFVHDEHDLCLDYEEQLLTHEKSGENLKKKGDELFNAGKSQDAVDVYSTAIICGPYNYQLYTKRAYAHVELQQYKCALSDGLRAIYLRPNYSKGYIRYIQSLNVCGENERSMEMKRIYHEKFTGSKEREQLRIALDHLFGMEQRKIEPTDEDRILNEKLVGLCKQASEAYRHGNIDEALFYYNDAILVSNKNKGWQHCLIHSDCQWFQLSLSFAYGFSLLKKGTTQCAQLALQQFSTILNKFTSITFPPAYWGMAMALTQLHRHGDALDYVESGIDKLSVYRPSPGKLCWPGTDKVIVECLAQNIQLKLYQLQVQCQPLTISDAVCRYSNCLQYYSSPAIQKDCHDYRGHVLMQCTESCTISYHSSCWRRFKSEEVMMNTEKEFLMSSCPTPDCHGTINSISVYNNKGKLQHRFEAPVDTTTKSDAPTSIVSGRRSSRGRQSGDKSRKRKTEERPSLSGMEEGKKDDVVLEDPRRVGDILKSRKKKSKLADSSTTIDQQHLGGLNEATGESSQSLQATEDCPKPLQATGDCPKPLQATGDCPKPLQATGDCPKPLQATGDSPKPLQATSVDCMPTNLIETANEFEAPSRKLTSQQPPIRTADISTSENLEFVFSYFAEIFRTHGPLLPTDCRLIDSLTFLPEEKTTLIDSLGGLKTFLLSSPMFVLKDDTLCLMENSSFTKSKRKTPLDVKNGDDHDSMNAMTGRKTKPNSNNGASTFTEIQTPALVDNNVCSSSVSIEEAEDKANTNSSPNYKNVGVSVSVQTDRPLVIEKWVMTDPLTPVENFREAFEKVSKEKNDLQVKLERSEDQRFKMQRDHKRELEKLRKKYFHEAKEEAVCRIKELEKQVVEEKSKTALEKREQAEQIRSLKAEIKSLTEKVDKMKREAVKKEKQYTSTVTESHRELERLQSENRRIENHLLVQSETIKKDHERAVVAEVELLSIRRDTVLRPGEQRLREVDNICANVPQGSDFHREWMAYRDKLKTALDCYQNAIDGQVHQVKSGRELATLDQVSNPTVPLPPQLAAFRMPMLHPRFIPMVPLRGPLPPAPHLSSDPTSYKAPHVKGAAIEPTRATMHQASATSNSLSVPTTSTSVTSSVVKDFSDAETSSSKKSSFERIMEKLAPLYPNYARDDFKCVLREVRRNNNNTLSGLSLDSIASQVKSIIDSKENNSSRFKQGKGKTISQATAKLQPKHLPRVALAPPPLISSTDYDDEGSCIICYEEMNEDDSSRLNCGHYFHTDCIRSWFKEQSTCPTCRNHSLLPEEYPLL